MRYMLQPRDKCEITIISTIFENMCHGRNTILEEFETPPAESLVENLTGLSTKSCLAETPITLCHSF